MSTIQELLANTFYLKETSDGWWDIMDIEDNRVTTARSIGTAQKFIKNYSRILAEAEPTDIIKQ